MVTFLMMMKWFLKMRNLFGDMAERSIEVIRTYSAGRFLFGAFSGGKDSVVIKELCRMGNIPVEWHYHVTTLDPPELVRFIKRAHPDVKFDIPAMPLLKRLSVKGFPTRIRRWCCAEYKECKANPDEVWIMGVRAAESPRRAKQWREFMVRDNGLRAINPILHWRDEDVWSFIYERKISYCGLYDQGFKRLGCVGCPMSGDGRKVQFRQWPHFERAWRKAFRELWDTGRPSLARYGSADEMFEWWMKSATKPEDDTCFGFTEMYSL
jgi:phosphoadenosine phosphosulfate reductase